MNTYIKQVGSTYSTKNIGQYGVFYCFVLICLLLSLVSPRFLTVSNWTIIVTQVSINALLAFGVTFVIITGGIDLSLGSIVAVTSVVAASLAILTDVSCYRSHYCRTIEWCTYRRSKWTCHHQKASAAFYCYTRYDDHWPWTCIDFEQRPTRFKPLDTFNFIGGGSIFGIPFPDPYPHNYFYSVA